MPGFELTDFTTPQAEDAFTVRRHHILQTAGLLGLQGSETEQSSLIFGGAAFALQGVDSYIGDRDFDVDAVVAPETFGRLRQVGWFGDRIHYHEETASYLGIVEPSRAVPLSAQLFTNDEPRLLLPFTGGVPYRGESNPATFDVEGLRVVRAECVAQAKSQSPRLRDWAGLVKAHVVARHSGHEITDNMLWRLSVGSTVGKLVTQGPAMLEIPAEGEVVPHMPYRTWLSQLIDRNFDHPAFSDIPRL